jgi:hypothetical protein
MIAADMLENLHKMEGRGWPAATVLGGVERGQPAQWPW